MSSKLKYYSYRRLRSFNAMWNFVLGIRGNGKSYGMKKIVISDAIKHGKQFIYLRRYRDELKLGRNTFFDDVGKEFPDHDFRINGNMAEYSPTSEQGNKKRKWIKMGLFMALSLAQNFKSASLPDVHTIMFDEFILEKGLTRYLPDEVKTMLGFYLTVDRYNDRVKVYFLANNVSINNPYFITWKIRPDEVGEYSTHAGGFICVNFINSKSFSNEIYKTRFGQFIKGTEFAEYATEGIFSDNHKELVDNKPPTAIYRFTIQSLDGYFSAWYDSPSRNWYVLTKRPKQEMLYVLDMTLMGDGKVYLERSSKILQYVRASFSQGRMFFDNQETRNLFLNVFKQGK